MFDRKKPEEILKQIQDENEKKRKGKLKIFFGYAAGVGKTYAMLKAAHKAKEQGVDVVVGYVEPHTRPETSQLLEGLEILPVKNIKHKQICLKEFDLDQALKRHPKLILVDELAHSNPEELRHKKRYQDVKELLDQGIDVYTTVNVQHIESLNDIVASITQVFVRERIPDYIFDEADQVEFIDIEPHDLLERLKEGKIYKKNEVRKAMNHFFTENHLISLREIALRRCADRITIRSIENHQEESAPTEHILVCISPSPSCTKVIRTAARMASAFKAKLTALYVETSEYDHLSKQDFKQLTENMHLAQQFGARLEVVYGDDVGFIISEYARKSKVSKVIIGRSPAPKTFLSKPTLVDQLISHRSSLDLYVIPVKEYGLSRFHRKQLNKPMLDKKDMFITTFILVIASLIGLLFKDLHFTDANIIMIYILAVFFVAIKTRHKFYSIFSSIVSVMVFNFLFTEPYLTLRANDPGYFITFIVMFIVASMTSTLANKMKQTTHKSIQVASRTKILLETNQMIQMKETKSEIVEVVCIQLMKLLNKDIVYYPAKGDKLDQPIPYSQHNSLSYEYFNENESAVANWVYHNNERAGASTNTLSNAQCLYLAIRSNETVFGVVGIQLKNETLDSFENNIVLSILGEAALALENESSREEKLKVSLKMKNEELRSQLLRMISHDLRTPLTSISGNASLLLSQEEQLTHSQKQEIYQNIYNDASWLIGLVENLLSITRIENENMKLNLSTELVSDLMNESLKHIHHDKINHHITYHQDNEYLMVKVDTHLFIQLMINLINNAIKYTQIGSHIDIHVYEYQEKVTIDVIDDGPGISDEAKKHIFEMFYIGNKSISDSRRSMGLGLFLCQSIAKAHGGIIKVLDHHPHGTIFRVVLPKKEVILHE